MSTGAQNSIRKRSPLRPGIEPIHVEELLTGAGMSGFLGILAPPAAVPHLEPECASPPASGADPEREAKREGEVVSAPVAPELATRFRSCVSIVASHVERQQEALAKLSDVAARITGFAQTLNRRAASFLSEFPVPLQPKGSPDAKDR